MFERFTDRARKVMALANQEAQRFNHEYIGTEHILLGLVKEGSGVGANVLRNLNVDLDKVGAEVEKLVKTGPDMITFAKLPQTPRAKMVSEYALDEARNLGHNYVGTEHLLLGLIREQDGAAAQVLLNLGLRLWAVREEVVGVLGVGLPGIRPVTASLPVSEPIRGRGEILQMSYGNRWSVRLCMALLDALMDERDRATTTGEYQRALQARDDADVVRLVLDRMTKRLEAEKPPEAT